MKKIYISLLVLIAIFVGIFVNEIQKTKNITVKKETTPIVSAQPINIPVYKNDQTYGTGPLQIIEFTDFNCKKCSEIHKKLIDFVKKDPSKSKLIWKGLPQTKIFSGDTKKIHQYAYCAGMQNKFWQFINLAMQDYNLNNSDLTKIITKLKLNTNSLNTCLGSQVELDSVTVSSSLFAKQVGFYKAPTIFINNYWINTDEGIDINEMLKNFIKK